MARVLPVTNLALIALHFGPLLIMHGVLPGWNTIFSSLSHHDTSRKVAGIRHGWTNMIQMILNNDRLPEAYAYSAWALGTLMM
jgi:hypothetical protein